jgi:hypothetical protein
VLTQHAELVFDFLSASKRYMEKPPTVKDPIRPATMNVITTAGCSIMVLNFFWFYKMVRGAIKVFRRPCSVKSLQGSMVATTIASIPANGAAVGGTAEVGEGLTDSIEVIDIPSDEMPKNDLVPH